MVLRATLLTCALLTLTTACGSAGDDGEKGGADPSVTPSASAQMQTPGELPGSGKVLETMNSGGYTYVKVDLGGEEVWAAGPEMTVSVGDTVTLPSGAEMRNYHSQTLDRTFPLVYFVGFIQLGGEAGSDADAVAAAHGSAGAGAATSGDVGPIEKAAGGRTVEEIVRDRSELAGQEIAVRGQVVKFNAAIMGSNWLHLQDGTGEAGTNDLTVTTSATVKVGDVVVVRGVVAVDKDFGGGYKYAVIVENATVAAE